MPIVHRHVIQYNSPTKRFDIHGILRDCISEFLKIQNLPGLLCNVMLLKTKL